jgi:uncharacterized protein with von Willebrand factor type A (vWA) domain
MWNTVMDSNGNHGLEHRPRGVPKVVHGMRTDLDAARLTEALSDLHNLLEEYAPSWYTQEHHDKAESALHPRKKR